MSYFLEFYLCFRLQFRGDENFVAHTWSRRQCLLMLMMVKIYNVLIKTRTIQTIWSSSRLQSFAISFCLFYFGYYIVLSRICQCSGNYAIISLSYQKKKRKKKHWTNKKRNELWLFESAKVGTKWIGFCHFRATILDGKY